ncbi:MAG: Spy/CpxP family protein refolding chaperone [Leptospirales bacterium]
MISRLIKLSTLVFFLFMGVAFLPATSFAANASSPPPGMEKLFKEMKEDFLLPKVFHVHPGPMFYMKNAKELQLSPTQIKKIQKIAHHIIPVTMRQTEKIDQLKDRYLSYMSQETPSPQKGRKMLVRIAVLEAHATSDHLKAHLECYHLLTPAQKKDVQALIKKS